MRRSYILAAAIGVLASTLGCGDNSKACGPGTTDMNGYCVPSAVCGAGTTLDPTTNQCLPDGSSCADGTMFDPTSGTCVIAGSACQDGTVLIGDACVDPTAGLTIDLDEGQTEPNGDGVIEASTHDAGTISLKQPGMPFVIHGTIAPFQDADGDGQLDPDVDTYELETVGPTLLEISADGLGGIDGGFLALGKVGAPLASWQRFGLNVTGSTSQRQVFLPRAGTYKLAIADTRTLLQYATGGLHAAAPGPGDYYISITQLAMPAPTPLAGASASGTTHGDVQFFTTAMGSGINLVALAMPSPQAAASPVVLADGDFRQQAAAATAGATSQLYVAGFAATDTALIAVDDVYNYAGSPIAYTLSVVTGDAQPLSTTGGAASELATISAFDPATGDPMQLQQFYFDVAGSAEIDGLNIAWSAPVVGSLFDGTLQPVAKFTALGGTTTWSSYAGLTRLLDPGRYYFFVYDPTATVGTTQLVATSRIEAVAAPHVFEGPSGSGPQTLDPSYLENAFRYDAGNDLWQTFDATGTATGGQSVAWYDPEAAFGRLADLVTSAGTAPGDVAPIFAHAYAEAGGPIGRVLIDDPTMSYLVVVTAANATGTFQLTFDTRAYTDLGSLASGDSASSTGHVLDATTTAGYFLFRTTAGNSPTITVHSESAALDTQFQRVAADESALGPLVNAASGDDVETFVQAGSGWTAVIVTAAANTGSNMYDVSVGIAP